MTSKWHRGHQESAYQKRFLRQENKLRDVSRMKAMIPAAFAKDYPTMAERQSRNILYMFTDVETDRPPNRTEDELERLGPRECRVRNEILNVKASDDLNLKSRLISEELRMNMMHVHYGEFGQVHRGGSMSNHVLSV